LAFSLLLFLIFKSQSAHHFFFCGRNRPQHCTGTEQHVAVSNTNCWNALKNTNRTDMRHAVEKWI